MTSRTQPENALDREYLATVIEFNCHRIAMIKLYSARMIECRKLADNVLAHSRPESGGAA